MADSSGSVWTKSLLLGAAVLGLGAVWAVRERNRPSACPYGQHIVLDLPRPFMRRERLRELLAPVPGEQILGVGPGTGYYTREIASAIGPAGRFDALDLQQPMLDELMQRAERRGIGNVGPARGDAQALPNGDATCDAAFLVATLGEIPDRDRALGELRRVLKPGGRLVDPVHAGRTALADVLNQSWLYCDRDFCDLAHREGFLVQCLAPSAAVAWDLARNGVDILDTDEPDLVWAATRAGVARPAGPRTIFANIALPDANAAP